MNKKEILLARHFATLAMVYAVIAMALGVFYREFTKFSGFAGRTSLSFLHTHYFALGMVFFLIQMLLEKTDSVRTMVWNLLLKPKQREVPAGLSTRSQYHWAGILSAGDEPGAGK